MMLPSQIKNQTFTSPKPGVYKASEVEEFKSKIYAAYCELMSSNAALKEKFASLSDLVNEYNEGKNSIAKALIKSQSYADEIIQEAEKKANDILEEKKNEADAYYATTVAQADECKKRAETELERVMSQVNAQAEEYIEKINEQAKSIIEDANNKASVIVSRAYGDAKKAREVCYKVVADANETLPIIKSEVSSFKAQSKKLLEIIAQAIDTLDVPDAVDLDFESDTVSEPETEKETETAEAFVYNVDNSNDDIEEIVVVEDLSEAEDIVEVVNEVDDKDDTSENGDASDYIFQRFGAFSDLFSSSDSDSSDDETDNNSDEE